MSTTTYLYAIDELGGFYLFPSLHDARRALISERECGLRPGLFRIPVSPSTAQEFADAVAAETADDHPILLAAMEGGLGDWQPVDTSTHYVNDNEQ